MGVNPCSSVSQGGQSGRCCVDVSCCYKQEVGCICATGITDLTHHGHIRWEYCVPCVQFP